VHLLSRVGSGSATRRSGAAAQRRSGAAAQRQDATDEPIPAIFGILEWAGTLRAESALKHSQPSRRA